MNGALPGILLPANPEVGQTFKQEVAIGVAEDEAEQVAAGESVTVGLGTFTDTIRYDETSALDNGMSSKVYARDVGILMDDTLERIPMSLTFCGTLDGDDCADDEERVDLDERSFSNPTNVDNPLFPDQPAALGDPSRTRGQRAAQDRGHASPRSVHRRA